jgi:hypothetical protein
MVVERKEMNEALDKLIEGEQIIIGEWRVTRDTKTKFSLDKTGFGAWCRGSRSSIVTEILSQSKPKNA